MSGGHHAPDVGDSEWILSLAWRVAILVAVLSIGADQVGRRQPTGEAAVAAADQRGDQPPSAGRITGAAGRAPVALGRAGVATASPEASQAGVDMLAAGGNAYDAAVAACFAVCVTRPHATGIGGGGFAVGHSGTTLENEVWDGRETAPASASRDMYRDAPQDSQIGPRAGGVPGLVALLGRLHEKGSGKVSWKQALQPAIELARQGCTVDRGLAAAIAAHQQDLARFPSSAQVFLPGGRPLREGDKLVQPDLAATLERIAEQGAKEFYTGETARLIAASTPISREDLAKYELGANRRPQVAEFRGFQVVAMPPPTSGGIVLEQVLRVLDGMELDRARAAKDGAYEHLLAEALRHAHADRSEHMGDPDFGKVPVDWLLGDTRRDQIRAQIDPRRARPIEGVNPGAWVEGDHTTHVSVIDEQGYAVSITHTVNLGLGSCFVVPGTGMLLNDEMDDFATSPGEPNAFGLVQGEKNAIKAGKRPLSSMTPILVLDRGGHVQAALGSPGGPKIISAVLQVFLNVFALRMPANDAMEAPRVHHQWRPDILEVEAGFPREAALGLARRGHVVRRGAQLGEVQAVFVVQDNPPEARVAAICDPRGTGQPAALKD